MSETRSNIKGAKGIMRNLERLAKPSTRRRVLRGAMGPASGPMTKAIKQAVPKDTGLLKKSIGRVIRTYKNGNVVAIIGPRNGFAVERNGKTVDPAKYGWPLEVGTRFAAPTFFMRNGFNGHSAGAFRILGREVEARVAKEVKKQRAL